MRRAIKNSCRTVSAYCLGEGNRKEKELIEEGKIRILPDGRYELFSQEAVNGQGEIAERGDYFKIDDSGFPYPNQKDWFESHHRCVGEDLYEQINEPLMIWQEGDAVSEEMAFLVDSGKLKIDPEDDSHYFSAFLWGAQLSAAKDATVVFYDVVRDTNGSITDISFNFVARVEFEQSYTIL